MAVSTSVHAQQDTLASDGGTEVALQICQQSFAVGVETDQPVADAFDGVDRFRGQRAAFAIIHQIPGLTLERHRDIQTLAALVKKLLHRDGKRIERSQQAVITDVLPRLPRKGGVDQRRLAVPDRVADDCITITHLRASLTDELVRPGERPGPRDMDDVGVLGDVFRKGRIRR